MGRREPVPHQRHGGALPLQHAREVRIERALAGAIPPEMTGHEDEQRRLRALRGGQVEIERVRVRIVRDGRAHTRGRVRCGSPASPASAPSDAEPSERRREPRDREPTRVERGIGSRSSRHARSRANEHRDASSGASTRERRRALRSVGVASQKSSHAPGGQLDVALAGAVLATPARPAGRRRTDTRPTGRARADRRDRRTPAAARSAARARGAPRAAWRTYGIRS